MLRALPAILLLSALLLPSVGAIGTCVDLLNVCVDVETFPGGVDVFVYPGGDILPQDFQVGCEPVAPGSYHCFLVNNGNEIEGFDLPP